MNLKDFEKTIEFVEFPENQYYKRKETKNQIVIHHTVSGVGLAGDIASWLRTPERVATAFFVERNGNIRQNFSEEYWAHHLGVTHGLFQKYNLDPSGGTNIWLNMNSIAIELDSWGGLVKEDDGKWYPAFWNTATKKYVGSKKSGAIERVYEIPEGFRGFYGFELYYPEQIEGLRKLLLFLSEKYNIPTDYHENMWDVSIDALSGHDGIWTHVSYRPDKSDCFPQKDLIDMLKSLKNENIA